MSFEVGDREIDTHYGEGEVISTQDPTDYPIKVKFPLANNLIMAYTADGFYNVAIIHKCLFHVEGYIEAFCREPKRLPFKCGDLVLVRDNQDEHWKCHIFQKYEEYIDNHYVCKNGFGYIFCIPYKGNEELLDTMREPEPLQEF